jgi:luciferase family oxidoreductase group 1
MLLFSVLDLAPIIEGGDATLAFRNSVDLARHAEQWGYHRFWLAEHHNMRGIASAATSVVIGHVAGATSRIRVGAGGVMLPNHAPLVIAEQFGTLAALYPGRIDLGLGRAPGSDQLTARALRRHLGSSGDSFPEDLTELRSYFQSAAPDQRVTAVPGAGANVPLYLLGSSDFSARLAAELGLPFAFASHFAPEYLDVALALYRRGFQPSEALAKPHVIVGMGIYAADTDEEARRLFTSAQLSTLNLINGRPGRVAAAGRQHGRPLASGRAIRHRATDEMHRGRIAGDDPRAHRRSRQAHRSDEIIAVAQIYDHAARLRSFEIAAGVFQQINSGASESSSS